MSTEPTTYEQTRALADAVRDGELTTTQRTALVDLLHSVATATRLASQAQEIDSDAATVGYLMGTWAPVERDFAALAATVTVSG